MNTILNQTKCETEDWLRKELGREPTEFEVKTYYANFLNIKIQRLKIGYKVVAAGEILNDIFNALKEEKKHA